MQESIEIFFCYAHEDEALRQGLVKQLWALKRQRIIDLWHDRSIRAGTEWEREIDQHLSSAQIVLLLISSDFMNSDYCYGIEMKKAMERHENGEARVIPIILRHVYWHGAPFGKLQALPTDAIPVVSSKWHSQDEAFFDVAEGIRHAVEELGARNEGRRLRNEGEEHLWQKRYQEALADFDHAITLDEKNASNFINRGETYHAMGRYQEALADFHRAIALDEKNARAFVDRGKTHHMMGNYEHALADFSCALAFSVNNIWAFIDRGKTYHMTGNYEHALADFDHAITLDENNTWAFIDRGETYHAMGHYQEALADFDHAITLDENNTWAIGGRERTFLAMKRQ